VLLDYADDGAAQAEQLAQQAATAKILLIAPVDTKAIYEQLSAAAAKDVKLISYDRLLTDTPYADWYLTFDSYKAGQLQGQYIKDKLDLDNHEGPFNVEPFAGAPEDNNARLAFEGAWEVLGPYAIAGKVNTPGVKDQLSLTAWAPVAVPRWDSALAKTEMARRLSAYQSQRVDAVLAPNDSIATGVAAALEDAGYKPSRFPVITGQDADAANVRAILEGTQSMTVWKDTRELVQAAVTLVNQLAMGQEPATTTSTNNGVRQVPSLLLEPVAITKDNVQELVESGFLTQEEIDG
jgi:putative multiple sugar transport system substrate-binding protein